MAYNLRQAFDRAYNRINLVEDITLDREYSIINSYSVFRELDDDQRDALLQLIENGLGYAHLSDQEVERLENLVFGSPEQDQDEAEADTTYTILEWNRAADSSTEWVQASSERELQRYAQCIQEGVSEDEPLMDMLIQIISPDGEHEIVSFNAYCRKHGIWRPSHRESEEAFRASMERVAGLI